MPAPAEVTASTARRARLRAFGAGLLRILGYGALCGLGLVALRYSEVRWLVIEHSVEIWGGVLAAIFAAFGIFFGLHLTRRRVETVYVPVEVEVPVEVPIEVPVEVQVPGPADRPFAVDVERQRQLGITPRELEILGLIAEGLSTREIATRLFVSENTVKTHSSRLFDKLGARRRTQAVQLGQAAGLLPGAGFTRKGDLEAESALRRQNHSNG